MLGLMNEISEAANESETLYEFIKKVYQILFYTKLVVFCTFFLLIFHISITFNGNKKKRFVITNINNILLIFILKTKTRN